MALLLQAEPLQQWLAGDDLKTLENLACQEMIVEPAGQGKNRVLSALSS